MPRFKLKLVMKFPSGNVLTGEKEVDAPTQETAINKVMAEYRAELKSRIGNIPNQAEFQRWLDQTQTEITAVEIT